MPLRTEAPRKTALVRAAIGASGNHPRTLFDREGLARHARFADKEVLRLDDEAVGRDQIACRKKNEITGYDSADGHRLLHPVPHHAAHQREAFLQLFDRHGRPVFLKETEQGAAEDDRQNDRRVHPLLQHQRDRGSESQDEDERALELAQKKAKCTEAWCIFKAVGADQGKLCRGAIGRQPARAGLQSCGQRGWILAPVGRVTVCPTHSQFPSPRGASDDRPEDRSDARSQRHRQRAPEGDAQGGLANIRPAGPRTDCAEQAKKDERRNRHARDEGGSWHEQTHRERQRRPHRKGRRRGQRRLDGACGGGFRNAEFVPRMGAERVLAIN